MTFPLRKKNPGIKNDSIKYDLSPHCLFSLFGLLKYERRPWGYARRRFWIRFSYSSAGSRERLRLSSSQRHTAALCFMSRSSDSILHHHSFTIHQQQLYFITLRLKATIIPDIRLKIWLWRISGTLHQKDLFMFYSVGVETTEVILLQHFALKY